MELKLSYNLDCVRDSCGSNRTFMELKRLLISSEWR